MIFILQDYFKEFRHNLKLAYPVIISLLGHTFVQLMDNVMVGQLGTADLAAVSLGNSFIIVAMCLGIGFSTAITPLVAEADGVNNLIRTKEIFYHGIILCFMLGIILSVLVIICRPLMYRMGQPIEVVELAYPYLKWVSISLFPLVVFEAFKKFSDGLSMTKPGMYATLFSNIINLILNFLLIFGIWIFPKMGVEGAGIGTLISRICMVLFIVIYFKLNPYFNKIIEDLNFSNINFNLIKKIINLGLPSALQMFFEVVLFTSAIWISGFLGKNSQAANQIALNLSTITFMFAMGLGTTAMIRVGIQKGKSAFVELKRIAFSIFFLIILLDIVFCLIFLTTNNYLPIIYLDFDNPLNYDDSIEVLLMASKLIIISAFFQIFDGLQAVALGALRGLQDVNIPTLITFFSYGIIGFPICYYLGIYTDLGVTGIWIGLLLSLFASSLLLLSRFQYLIKKLIK